MVYNKQDGIKICHRPIDKKTLANAGYQVMTVPIAVSALVGCVFYLPSYKSMAHI